MRWLQDLGSVPVPAFEKLKHRLQDSTRFQAGANSGNRTSQRPPRCGMCCTWTTRRCDRTRSTSLVSDLLSTCSSGTGLQRSDECAQDAVRVISGICRRAIGDPPSRLCKLCATCVQIVTTMKKRIAQNPQPGLSAGAVQQRARCVSCQSASSLRPLWRPLGFRAHALGVLATRNISLLLGTPHALAAHFAMLRSFFHPWGRTSLAEDIRRDQHHASLPACCGSRRCACYRAVLCTVAQ